MNKSYQHLGIYSDLVSESLTARPLYPSASPGKKTQARVGQVLRWGSEPASPQEVKVEEQGNLDGLHFEQLSWSVGYGPRTQAWFFKPEDR